jgi:signal peptidase I
MAGEPNQKRMQSPLNGPERVLAGDPARRRDEFTPREPEAHGAVRRKSVVREWAEALSVALLLALFIRAFVVQAFKIPSGSMLPTLQIGDHILVNKFAYGVRAPWLGWKVLDVGAPRRGDIIVFIYPEDPEKDFIKRVVGIGGDVLEVREKKLFRNGKPALDPHAHFTDTKGRFAPPLRDNYGPYTVPDGHVFVMGDNRDSSHDSRFWGPVKLEQLKGKAFLIYWSWDGGDRWVRWERIGELIY